MANTNTAPALSAVPVPATVGNQITSPSPTTPTPHRTRRTSVSRASSAGTPRTPTATDQVAASSAALVEPRRCNIRATRITAVNIGASR